MTDPDDRTQYIGGSDLAPILGVSPYATALDVYLRKTGEAPEQEMSEPMRWGTLLEPVILARYAEATGIDVTPGVYMYDDSRHWLRGHLDGLAPDRVVEVKATRSAQDWGEPGTDQIPIYYVPQVQLYMYLAHRTMADVPVLIGGSDFRVYTVARDDALIGGILGRAAAFWHEHILARVPPAPVNLADVRALFKRDSGIVQIASPDVVAAAQALASVKAVIRRSESEAERLEFVLQSAMRDAAELVTDSGDLLATWRTTKPGKRFDASAFKAAHPYLHAQYSVESTSRRFLLKLKEE